MNEETPHTKIPKLRPMRGNTFSIEFNSMKSSFPPKKLTTKASSLINLAYQYKNLTPEQCEVKYKKYPRKISRRSCMVCSMRRPQKKKFATFYELKKSKQAMFTQTPPSSPVRPRWNVESQTDIPQKLKIRTLHRHTQTRELNFPQHDKLRKRPSYLLRCLFSFVVILIAVILASFRFNSVQDLLHQRIIPPKNLLERILSHLNRNNTPVEPPVRDLSNTIVPTVGSIMFCLCINLILSKLGICNLFRM